MSSSECCESLRTPILKNIRERLLLLFVQCRNKHDTKSDKAWVTYRFSYAMRHNDVNHVTSTPTPYYMRHFQIFDKMDSFLKNVSKIRTAWFTYNCWLAFFFFRYGFQEKIQKSWRNCLIWIGQCPTYTGHTYYFLIRNCSNTSNFLNWR